MAELVGHYRKYDAGADREAVLRTSDAYACAYDHLYPLLPDCRACGCV